MQPLNEFYEHAQARGREDFVAEYSAPVFVFADPEIEDDLRPMQNFRTQTRLRREPSEPLPVDYARYRVAVVVTQPESPWGDRVAIGRARNNDILIRHNSVSKLHAFVLKKGDDYFITDASSRNGVLINGNPITPEEETRLESGDELAFGDIQGRFLLAPDFFAFLEGLPRSVR